MPAVTVDPSASHSSKQFVQLTPKQAQVFHSNLEQCYLVGKTQSGKSFVAGFKMFAEIMSRRWPIVGEDFNGFAVFGATSEQARATGGRYLATAARAANVKFTPARAGPMWIDGRWPVYPHGIGDTHSEQALVGRTYGTSLFEEIVQCNQTALEYAESRCSVPGSQLIYTCNPNHSDHWVLRQRIDPADGIRSGVWNFSFEDNPNIDWAYVRRLKRTLSPMQFKNLWLGEWADAEGAMWTSDDIHGAQMRAENAPRKYERVIVSVDPAKTAGPLSHYTALCVIGASGEDAYVLDCWRGRWEPEEWARHVGALFAQYGCSFVVIEDNAIGKSVESVFKAAGVHLPLKRVSVSASKGERAEPVKALYNDRHVWHVRDSSDETKLAELEGEMVTFTGDKKTQVSPDDATDAMVNGVTWLILRRKRFGLPR